MFSIRKHNYRNLVVGVDTKVPLRDGSLVTAINFDNAATTPPFYSVMQDIAGFAPWYSSVHRGTGYKSIISSDLYEKSRLNVLKFIKADIDKNTVIYVKNTTEAINKLSHRLCKGTPKCMVLSTDMEHHSNDLPWRKNYTVDYIEAQSDGRLSMENLEEKLKWYGGRVKLVAATGASNVTGYINPIHKIAAISHKYGAKIFVDGAQFVPHVPVNIMPQDDASHIDFIAFSAHKMYAPFGIGVLVGPKPVFYKGVPDYVGGGTVKVVTHGTVKWDDPPQRDEAGTPNLMGIIALMSSMNTLCSIGMDNIQEYERQLTLYGLKKLSEIPGITIYGDSTDCSDKVGIISFNINGIHHNTIASALSMECGIAVRSGCFCAQPYIQKLMQVPQNEILEVIHNPKALRPGMVRISFGLYNTFDEIDKLCGTLHRICDNKELYIKQYKE